MKKPKNEKIIEVEAATTSLNEHQVSEFLHKYGSIILYTLIGLVAAIAIFYQFTRSSETSSLKDYLKADRIYHQFLNAPPEETSDALKPLQKLMARHPDLKQKYEGKVAQALISKDQIVPAQPYIDDSLTRIRNEKLPHYLEYTEATLLISNGDYEEAYKRANELHDQLLEIHPENPENDTLFAFNLLRLATLQQKLGLYTAEQKSWEQLLTYGETDSAVTKMLKHVSEGHVSLKSYVQNRLQEWQ